MLDEAADQFEKLEVRAPDLPVVHAYLGAVFERRGETRDGVRRVPPRARASATPSTGRIAAHGVRRRRRRPGRTAARSCQRWNTLRPLADSLTPRACTRWAVAALDLVFPACVRSARATPRRSGRRDPLCGGVLGGDRAARAALLRPLRSAVADVRSGAAGTVAPDGCRAERAAPIRPAWDWARAGAAYGGAVRDAIHAFKFGGKRALARPLAALIGEQCAAGLARDVDALVPVPLAPAPASASAASTRRRSWPSDSARGLGVAGPAPAGSRGCGDTPPQSDLGAAERRANVRGAFAAARRGGRPPRGRRGRRAHDRRHRGGVRARAARGGGAGGSGSSQLPACC